jgi:hypothetical protein
MTLIINRVFDSPLKKGNRQHSKVDLLTVLHNRQKAAELILKCGSRKLIKTCLK